MTLDIWKRTFELNDFNGIVLFTHAEDFKITEDGLLGLGVPIDFDAQEIALVLPIEFTLKPGCHGLLTAGSSTERKDSPL